MTSKMYVLFISVLKMTSNVYILKYVKPWFKTIQFTSLWALSSCTVFCSSFPGCKANFKMRALNQHLWPKIGRFYINLPWNLHILTFFHWETDRTWGSIDGKIDGKIITEIWRCPTTPSQCAASFWAGREVKPSSLSARLCSWNEDHTLHRSAQLHTGK